MLNSYYDKPARVHRHTISMGNKKEFTTHIASLACHIQPLDDQISQDITGGFGKNFLMFSSNADIIEGDRVIVESDEYRVMGTESLSFKGESHRETILRIFKS